MNQYNDGALLALTLTATAAAMLACAIVIGFGGWLGWW